MRSPAAGGAGDPPALRSAPQARFLSASEGSRRWELGRLQVLRGRSGGARLGDGRAASLQLSAAPSPERPRALEGGFPTPFRPLPTASVTRMQQSGILATFRPPIQLTGRRRQG